MWDLWWTEWNCDRFFPEYFGFPLSISFHRCSVTRKRTKNNHFHLHHRFAQRAFRLRGARSVCCGALLHLKQNGLFNNSRPFLSTISTSNPLPLIHYYKLYLWREPISVAAWSKAWVSGRSLPGIEFESRRGMFVSSKCCALSGLSPCDSFRWVLPAVCVSNCVWSGTIHSEAAYAQVGLLRHRKENIREEYFETTILQNMNALYFISARMWTAIQTDAQVPPAADYCYHIPVLFSTVLNHPFLA
jgi:hypothetical protein